MTDDFIGSLDDFGTIQLVQQSDQFEWEKQEQLEVLQATDKDIDRFACSSTIEFAEKHCGIVPNERQKALNIPWWDPLQKKIWDSVDAHPNTIIFSGNGIGKTMALALEALRRFYAGYAVVTSAPVKRQIENLWSEIRTAKDRAAGRGIILPGRWSPRAHYVEMDPKWTLSGYTARVTSGETISAAFSGKHHTRMFGLLDELVGVPKPIWEAMLTLLVGEEDKFLGCGNPHNPTAYAAEAAKMQDQNKRPIYNVIHLNSEDHSNVKYGADIIKGAVTRKFVGLQLAKGGSRDSAVYRTTVLGQFPNQDEDALILAQWVEEAKSRGEARYDDKKIQEIVNAKGHRRDRRFPIDHRGVSLGLDVAGEGKDLTVMVGCEGAKLFFPELKSKTGSPLACWHRGRDHTHATELLIQGIKQIPRVLSVSIDDTGLGAAVSAELWKRAPKEFPEIPIFITKGPLASPSEMRTKCVVTRINFGMSPAGQDAELFGSIKDSLWWAFREALRTDKIHLPCDVEHRAAGFPDESDLFAQIQAPIMWKDVKGKLHILDKQSAYGGKGREVSKHLPSISPDIAHAALLAWWSWAQLPPRYAAPENPIEIAKVQKEAEIESRLPINTNKNFSGLRPFQKRAR